jgi:hypothetical protein
VTVSVRVTANLPLRRRVLGRRVLGSRALAIWADGRWTVGRWGVGRWAVAAGLALIAPVATAAAPAAGAPTAGAGATGAAATGAGPVIVAPAPTPAATQVAPLSEAEFASRLASADLAGLDALCRSSLAEDDRMRLSRLRQRLLAIDPAPQPLPVVLANADVLLSCQAPQAALEVLGRYGPGPGAGRVQWLLLQWRAATAALDHRRAALALERLSASDPATLGNLLLPIQRREDGTVLSRAAVDLLADHLEGRGLRRAAAELLLASGQGGAAGAERLQRAVRLFDGLPLAEREALLETALEQAAAVGAWSLVTEILDEQTDLDPPSARAIERRLRLSGRLDDAYGEWRLRRRDPATAARSRQL